MPKDPLEPKAIRSAQNASPTETIHSQEPDYDRPVFQFSRRDQVRIQARLRFLYGDETAAWAMDELKRICQVYHAHKTPELIEKEKGFSPSERFTQKDVILITYGDLLKSNDDSPLTTLGRFCDSYLEGNINTIHILPFFPYSSDRGFSIVDFETVDPKLGTWADIWGLEQRYQLMFDGVINHVSAKSRWFQEFLNGNSRYQDFFITFDSHDELTENQRRAIFRPRTSDILTPYQTIKGKKYVWTTFSKDQVDLNYKNPMVLLRVLEILLLYVRQGADIIRLDAVTYLWAELGTSCVHLKQTHEIVKLLRDILDCVAPMVALITETNVPHHENISYFGDGTDEAHMVYNFALPPLVLHTFYTQDTTAISRWAENLTLASETVTFFNILDSHDGIGLMAVKEILSQVQIKNIIETAKENGGLVSYKTAKDGTEEPYELNVTWFSALNKTDSKEDLAFQVRRFVASRIISFVIQGVPGIYLHSLIGTENDIQAVMATESKRDINRRVLDYEAIQKALADPFSKIARINRELGRLITLRTKQPAFHPNASQRVLDLSPQVFSVLRIAPDKSQLILALINVTDKVIKLKVPLDEMDITETHWFDLVSEMEWHTAEDCLFLTLLPYDVVWLEPKQAGEALF